MITTQHDAEEVKDQFGTLVKYKCSLPLLIARKIDAVLLKNLAFKCRGFLSRQSLKKSNKWSNCFCFIDLK